ncbi:putative lipid II flippase FtsW [Aquisalimonas asiatica]|uniref:Probable peptidoglycan glycosyltransferase FtsW n=1 Tax=Aquisalimonas asiatica TaxID=406100 RepID=A0A1H8S7R9_9GAMM|nr:putative lipid II flippase FtsW [Aquisalimonas asiatica]SEO74685.1 cell division-specific peptidoglycan biosynthesis regulator FtsW [Aquisalimonas asiatica]
MSVPVLNAVATEARRATALWPNLDQRLLLAIAAAVTLGIVAVTSASVSLAESQFGSPFYYLNRQLLFLGLTLAASWMALQVPVNSWYQASGLLLLLAMLLLVLVLVPGVGREVNGATRWIPVGIFHLQVSEVAKFGILFYLAAYLVRRGDRVRGSMQGFLIPIVLLGASGLLLLMQPDFGGALVLGATGLGLLFLAGVPLWRFLVLASCAGGAAWMLIVTSPYRITRLMAFIDPWADPFNTGFQLTQSLIAIGRGEWFGVGLGASVQKLFYLPEAHTDFVFAVLAEELGLVGVVLVLVLYSWIVWRILSIGAAAIRANQPFGGYLCFAVGFWLGLQSFINIGVNMGLLPTKGLTLPLMSYGGSSLLTTGVALAVVLRVDYERRMAKRTARPGRSS